MENQEEFNDEMLGKYVKMSTKTLPNEEFEHQLMSRITDELAYKQEVLTQLKLSFRIFITALIAAIILMITVMLHQVLDSFWVEVAAIAILFVGGVIGILNIDNYRRLIRKYSV